MKRVHRRVHLVCWLLLVPLLILLLWLALAAAPRRAASGPLPAALPTEVR